MTTWFVLIALIAGSYLLGSVPVSFLAGRSRGVDLRRHGTGQIGGGNLWRTTSRTLGLMSGLFDFVKGMAMVWIAQLAGLEIAMQIVVGLAAIVGHNWPVFLRFHGGRGVATLLGIILILPLINDMSPWPSIAFVIIGLILLAIIRSTPLPVFVAVALLPLVSWVVNEPPQVTLAFLAMFLLIIIKRILAEGSGGTTSISKRQLFINRLLFDRDIRDKKVWMNRKPESGGTV